MAENSNKQMEYKVKEALLGMLGRSQDQEGLETTRYMLSIENAKFTSDVDGYQQFGQVYHWGWSFECPSTYQTAGPATGREAPKASLFYVRMPFNLQLPVLLNALAKKTNVGTARFVILISAGDTRQEILQINFTGVTIDHIKLSDHHEDSFEMWFRYETIEIKSTKFKQQDMSKEGSVAFKFDTHKNTVT